MMAELSRSLFSITMSYTSSAIKGAGSPVFGCTCARICSTTSENILWVLLCRLDTAMRAARMENSGCCVAMYAAVCAASSSSSDVVTPGYTPVMTFCEMITGSTYSGSRP